MNDLVERHAAEYLVQLAAIRNIRMHKRKGLCPRLQLAQGALLDGGIVKIIEIIQRANSVSGLEQAFTDMRTNKPHAAGDQKIHARKLTGNRLTVEGIGWA